ncbi:VWA domain-containing protein [Alteromonas sp. a30]|uniref:VWA domain-containing protein n=1 Tax=Alteromonas sp. a30 TaxID=2730917 RepID=UPI0022832D01|nr:VWA domain-containing protein [Alteromonas sp. a30]MCY7296905.1 VWA domain-containing protein [Alteromonas sp. a30]
MAEKRKEDGFNVSFLDVMACGLGAVLLILILVKFSANTSIPSDEVERLKQELNASASQASQLQKSIDEVNDKIAMETDSAEELKRKIEELKIQQDAVSRALADKKAVVANLEQSIAAAAPKQSDDLVKIDGAGEEQYLLGLKVEGEQIGILLDMSASMTDEKLIDIIKRKVGSDQKKTQGPKWLRTKRIAKWLIARLPKTAKVSLVAFNDSSQVLGLRPVNSAKVQASVQALVKDIDTLIPHNGTNLMQGLKAIKKAMPQMTDLYVVTDGLPTMLDDGSGFRTSRNCKPLPSAKTISGECRMSVFMHTLNHTIPKGVRTNIVLLPLEGEPHAPAAYWNWADLTGGLMISPAGSWP